MKKFILHFSVFLVFFLIINFILAFLWSPINDNILSKIFKKKHYSKEILELINIQDKEQSAFYEEMWVKRKFKYIQFAEHLEAETKQQKYVNVTENFGRKVENNNNCEVRYFFYGGSGVFGYNVKDDQTIPSYFKKILIENLSNKNICVYNFGTASYFSTQENILLIKHILDNKIKENDYAIFLNGHTEEGNKTSRINQELKKIFDGLDLKLWDELKFSTLILINSLPVIKLYKNLENKFSQKKNELNINENNLPFDEENLIEIKRVFKNNIKMRNAICQNMKINCFTFLQPFPKIHGILGKSYMEKEISFVTKKYLDLKEVSGIVDISKALDNQQILSYIDTVHYSPYSNELIAKEMVKVIIN